MATAERKPVTRDRVLEAAMSIADAEGLSAVSMRRVATELQVEAMSLYHHVANKDALLDGLVERVVTEALEQSSSAAERANSAQDDWRVDVRTRSLAARQRHAAAPLGAGAHHLAQHDSLCRCNRCSRRCWRR